MSLQSPFFFNGVRTPFFPYFSPLTDIFAHSIMNILSAFSNVEIMNTTSVQIIVSLILIVVSIGYALYIKNMPNDC